MFRVWVEAATSIKTLTLIIQQWHILTSLHQKQQHLSKCHLFFSPFPVLHDLINWLCCHWAEPNICHLNAHNITILLPTVTILPSYSPLSPSNSPNFHLKADHCFLSLPSAAVLYCNNKLFLDWLSTTGNEKDISNQLRRQGRCQEHGCWCCKQLNHYLSKWEKIASHFFSLSFECKSHLFNVADENFLCKTALIWMVCFTATLCMHRLHWP